MRRSPNETVDMLAEQLIGQVPEDTRYTKQQIDLGRTFPSALTSGHLRNWLTVLISAEEIVPDIGSFSEKRSIDYRRPRTRLANEHHTH